MSLFNQPLYFVYTVVYSRKLTSHQCSSLVTGVPRLTLIDTYTGIASLLSTHRLPE